MNAVRLTVAPELALDFLAIFSRFEFALKVTRFRKPGGGEAKADWVAFAGEVSASFKPSRTADINEAFNYITGQPLRYLGIRNGSVAWLPFVPDDRTEADKVIHLIKQVRNNLFHGGKFARDPEAGHDRDTRLLSASIVLLHELLSLEPDVCAAFNS